MPPIKEESLPPRVRKPIVSAYRLLGMNEYDIDSWSEILKCAGICYDIKLARKLRLDYLETFPLDMDVWEDAVKAEMQAGDPKKTKKVLEKCLNINHTLQAQTLFVDYAHWLGRFELGKRSTGSSLPITKRDIETSEMDESSGDTSTSNEYGDNTQGSTHFNRDTNCLLLDIIAHKQALNKVGYDINAVGLWLSYIKLLKKRASIIGVTEQVARKTIEDILKTYVAALSYPIRFLSAIYEDYLKWTTGMDEEETTNILPSFPSFKNEIEATYRVTAKFASQRIRLYRGIPSPFPRCSLSKPIAMMARSKNAVLYKNDYTLEDNRMYPEIVRRHTDSNERFFTNKQVFDAFVFQSNILDDIERKNNAAAGLDGLYNSRYTIRSPIDLINKNGVEYELQDIPIPSFGSGTSLLLHNKGLAEYDKWVRAIETEEIINRQLRLELGAINGSHLNLSDLTTQHSLLCVYRLALVELRYWPGMWMRFIDFSKTIPSDVVIDVTPPIHITEEEKEKTKRKSDWYEPYIKENTIDGGGIGRHAIVVPTDYYMAATYILGLYAEAVDAMPTCGLLHMAMIDHAIEMLKQQCDACDTSDVPMDAPITCERIHEMIDEMMANAPSPVTVTESMIYYASLGEFDKAHSLFGYLRRHPELNGAPVIDTKEVVKESEDEVPTIKEVKITEEERCAAKPGHLILYAPSDPTVSRTTIVPVRADLLIHFSVFLTAACVVKNDPGKPLRSRRDEAREILETAIKTHSCQCSYVAECTKLLATNDDADVSSLRDEESPSDPLTCSLNDLCDKTDAVVEQIDKTASLKAILPAKYSSNHLYYTAMKHYRWGMLPISSAFLDVEQTMIANKMRAAPSKKHDSYSNMPIRSTAARAQSLKVMQLNVAHQSMIYLGKGTIFLNREEAEMAKMAGSVGKLGVAREREYDEQRGEGGGREGGNEKKRIALPSHTPAILAALVSVLPPVDIKQMHLPLREEFIENITQLQLGRNPMIEKAFDFLYQPMPYVPKPETAFGLMRGIRPDERGMRGHIHDSSRDVVAPVVYDPRIRRD